MDDKNAGKTVITAVSEETNVEKATKKVSYNKRRGNKTKAKESAESIADIIAKEAEAQFNQACEEIKLTEAKQLSFIKRIFSKLLRFLHIKK